MTGISRQLARCTLAIPTLGGRRPTEVATPATRRPGIPLKTVINDTIKIISTAFIFFSGRDATILIKVLPILIVRK